MDTRKSNPTSRKWLSLLLLPLFLALAGCDLKVVDLTPSTMKANASGVYTITARVNAKNSAVIEESIQPEVIIDGKAHRMTRAPGGANIYEYDYELPPGRDSAKYYILVRYDRRTPEQIFTKERHTELSSFSVERRYSVELETDRAPVGTKVAILGRGFTPSDKVTVGGTPAPTTFESSTSLSFYVPSLPEGRNYTVTVLGAQGGEMNVGTLRVDPSQIRVTPSSLTIPSGSTRQLTFNISPNQAPPGGLQVRVTTDAALRNSIIMPVVRIAGGQSTVSVPVQADNPGEGKLFVEVPGYSEVVVPVTVR